MVNNLGWCLPHSFKDVGEVVPYTGTRAIPINIPYEQPEVTSGVIRPGLIKSCSVRLGVSIFLFMILWPNEKKMLRLKTYLTIGYRHVVNTSYSDISVAHLCSSD